MRNNVLFHFVKPVTKCLKNIFYAHHQSNTNYCLKFSKKKINLTYISIFLKRLHVCIRLFRKFFNFVCVVPIYSVGGVKIFLWFIPIFWDLFDEFNITYKVNTKLCCLTYLIFSSTFIGLAWFRIDPEKDLSVECICFVTRWEFIVIKSKLFYCFEEENFDISILIFSVFELNLLIILSIRRSKKKYDCKFNIHLIVH